MRYLIIVISSLVFTSCSAIWQQQSTSVLMDGDEFIHLKGLAVESALTIASKLGSEPAAIFLSEGVALKRVISAEQVSNQERMAAYKDALMSMTTKTDDEHWVLTRINDQISDLSEFEIKTLLSLHYTELNVAMLEAVVLGRDELAEW